MMKFLWPAVLAVLGTILLVDEIHERQDYLAFQAHGENAVVDPIKNYTETTHKKISSGQVTGVSYKADLTFRTKSGNSVTVPERDLPQSVLDTFNRGAKVTIEYLPEKPTTTRFPDSQAYSDYRLVAVGMMLIGGIWIFLLWWRARAE